MDPKEYADTVFKPLCAAIPNGLSQEMQSPMKKVHEICQAEHGGVDREFDEWQCRNAPPK